MKSQKICKISQRKKSSDTLNKPIGSQLPTKPLCHISTTFSCCQNYKLGHVGKNKSAITKANQEGKSVVFVPQMYSKSLTERRNAALKYQADLKEISQDPSIQGYVKFPAIPMIKHTGERKYSLEK